jgi:hypothetical protein
MVGTHLWVCASTRPGYDPTPVLETVFADVSAVGLDCVEPMHHALRHEDAVELIGGSGPGNRCELARPELARFAEADPRPGCRNSGYGAAHD